MATATVPCVGRVKNCLGVHNYCLKTCAREGRVGGVGGGGMGWGGVDGPFPPALIVRLGGATVHHFPPLCGTPVCPACPGG